MTTDWDVLRALKEKLITELPEFFSAQADAEDLLTSLDSKQIVIDDYDIDNLPAKVSVFLCPSYEEQTSSTYQADDASYTVDLYFINKGLDKKDLVRQAQAYKAAIEHLIGVDRTLGGVVDYVAVQSSNWFSGIEGVGTARGFKLELLLQWQKQY